MAERVLHCWAGKLDTDDLEIGSDEWVNRWVRKEEGEDTCTCMLPQGHDGPHEWTPDSEITITFTLEVPHV